MKQLMRQLKKKKLHKPKETQEHMDKHDWLIESGTQKMVNGLN